MLQFPPLTPAVRAMLVVFVLSFLAQTIAEGALDLPVTTFLAFRPILGIGLAWQWLTYPLVEVPAPGAAFSRALSLLFLYLMLAPHEARFGARAVLGLSLAGIVAGAAVVLAAGLLAPDLVSGAVGPSPIVWAAFGAFAVLAGGQPVRFFMLPPASAWSILGLFLAFPLLDAFWSHDLAPFLLAAGSTGAGILWGRRAIAPKRSAKVPPKKAQMPGRFRVIEGGGEGERPDKPRWLN